MVSALKINPALTKVNFDRGRRNRRVRAIVLHITDGDTAASAIGWFHNPKSEVSAHYVIDRDGTVYSVVDEADTAWTNGELREPRVANPTIWRWARDGINPNSETVTIEAVGRPAHGWTTAQLAAARYLIATSCRRWHITPGPETVIQHSDINSVTRARCASLTDAQMAILRAPLAQTDDELLEAVYQRDPERWGDRRYSANLATGYHTGKVMRTTNALLTTDGRNLVQTNPGNLLDDWEQRMESIGALQRY